MKTFHPRQSKGSVKSCSGNKQICQCSAHQFVALQSTQRTVVIGLRAPSPADSCLPQSKGSKGRRVNPTKAINSGNESQWPAHKPVALPLDNSTMKSLHISEESNIPGLCTSSPVRCIPELKRSKGRVNRMKSINSACEHPSQRPRQQKKCKRVAVDSSDSERTRPSVSRIRGQARRRVNSNYRHHGKLDDILLNKYLRNLWQSISSDKKDSSAYIDCLWFNMYHEESDREKVLKWIRRERIFSRKYVFLPICRWRHWSLLIFCHLGEDLQSKTKTPCMLLLDSLHNANPRRFEPDIRKFLLDIYKVEGRSETKKQIDKIPLLVPKVPQQNDDKECGYFVLYYISLFLMSSPETFSICDGYPYFMSKYWFTAAEFKSFCKTLPSFDQETGLGDDVCDKASDDDVLLIE